MQKLQILFNSISILLLLCILHLFWSDDTLYKWLSNYSQHDSLEESTRLFLSAIMVSLDFLYNLSGKFIKLFRNNYKTCSLSLILVLVLLVLLPSFQYFMSWLFLKSVFSNLFFTFLFLLITLPISSKLRS